MTEAEWLACTDPRVLLDHVRSRAGGRKLRLFACACARQVWAHLADPRSRAAVEAAERFADGGVPAAELLAAEAEAFEVARGADLRTTVSDPAWSAARAAARAASGDAYGAATGAAFTAALAAAPWRLDGGAAHHGDARRKAQARARQCAALRDIVGNPFRFVVLEPAWLAWGGSAARRLARDIDAEGRYDEMPVLGDALMEAGCDREDVLAHCREGGPHVRGCWVLDLVLGRG